MTKQEPIQITVPSLICFVMLTAILSLSGPLMTFQDRLELERSESEVARSARTLLAEYCFTKSQAYFHSGAYFTIFDHEIRKSLNCAEDQSHASHPEESWRQESPFTGPVLDPLDQFARHFYPVRHTHLSSGGTKEGAGSQVHEMLPWLELSILIDPYHIDSYTEADFWLRRHLRRPEDAAGFRRRGLLHNPENYEINFLLGQVEAEKDPKSDIALRLWNRALTFWNQQNMDAEEPDTFALRKITSNLATLEERRGNLKEARDLVQCLVNCRTDSKGPAQWLNELDQQIIAHQ